MSLSTTPPRRNARYTPLAVDGPLPLDMVRGARAMLRDPLGWLEGAVATHGDLVALPLPRTPVLLVNTPAGARRVLQENHGNYTKRTVQYGALSAVTGAGLLTADGEPWRRHRRLVQPAFHHGRLAWIADVTADAADDLRRRWDEAGPGVPVDADAAVMRVMLDVVGRTLFAADLASDGSGAEVVRAVDDALRAVLVRARSPLGSGPLNRVPTPSRRRLRRATAVLDELCAHVVATRRARGVDPDDGDLLAVLLRAGDGLTDAEIRDELVTMVIAGHETVASSLTWTLHLLAGAPDVQRRLHAELDAVLADPAPDAAPVAAPAPAPAPAPAADPGAAPAPGAGGPATAHRAPRWADVPHLTFTRAVVDESLRLYPPAWVITRRATGADLVDGVEVPAGTLVLVSPWLLHRRAESWPEPLRFDPDRFAGPTARGAGPRREGYLPFGSGPRLCIGRDVALVQATLVLAGLLRDRSVRRPAGAAAPAVDALVTLRPRGGMPLLMEPRERRSTPAAAPPTTC